MPRNLLTAAFVIVALAACAGKPAPETAAPAAAAAPSSGESAERRVLPPPDKAGRSALYAVLAARRSARTYGDRPLTDAEVGQLLWAGQGITSPDGKRTAPSAGALYPLNLYYFDESGVWRYDARGHALIRVTAEDKRGALAAAASGQASLKNAAAIIVIVAKPTVTAAQYGARAERYCALEAGHVAQNILLTATALGLGACPAGAFDDDGVRAVLSLAGDYLPLYLIPVGAGFEPGREQG